MGWNKKNCLVNSLWNSPIANHDVPLLTLHVESPAGRRHSGGAGGGDANGGGANGGDANGGGANGGGAGSGSGVAAHDGDAPQERLFVGQRVGAWRQVPRDAAEAGGVVLDVLRAPPAVEGAGVGAARVAVVVGVARVAADRPHVVLGPVPLPHPVGRINGHHL